MGNLFEGRLAVSIREASNAIGISESSLYQMAQRGKITTIKIGGRRLIPTSALRVLMVGDAPEAKLVTGEAPRQEARAATEEVVE